MNDQDLHQFLKEAGYLSSPASRYFWKGAKPTGRYHFRQVWVLGLVCALPFAAFMAALAKLAWVDKVWVFLLYVAFALVAMIVFDLVLGWVMRSESARRLFSSERLLTWFPIPAAGLAALAVGFHFSLAQWPAWTQVLIAASLALMGWLVSKAMTLLIVSRLYWHGMRLPRMQPHPFLMALLLVALLVVMLGRGKDMPTLPEPKPQSPLVVLGFDIPPEQLSAFQTILPSWQATQVQTSESDIARFWTTLGSGTGVKMHQSSLVSWRVPLFEGPMNEEDPSLFLPLEFFKALQLAQPEAVNTRQRKYFWEILDAAGLHTYALGFWHTFPAGSRNGAVLSERWTSENHPYPFSNGLKKLEPQASISLSGVPAVDAAIQRENQIWAQLVKLSEGLQFDLAVAYLPLADLHHGFEPQNAKQMVEALLLFRKNMLTKVFSSLPADSRILVLVSSGKTKQDMPHVKLSMYSNWWQKEAAPLNDIMNLAPTILDLYGLPKDRLMGDSLLLSGNNQPTVDFGRYKLPTKPFTRDHANYLEELKTLGYVN